MAATREKLIQQAERLVGRGKVEAAIREYRKVLADNPRDTNTLNRVGDLYARLERNDEAIALFTRIAEHYTDDGFFVKAIAIYKKIIKLDPTRLDIYERLAELYHRQGLVNEARTQYQVLVDYYQKHHDAAAATAVCRRMVELEPGNPSHRARLADLLEQQGAIAEAIGEYRTIGGQLLASGQWEGASRVFEKALDVDPQNEGFLREAIQSLRGVGQEGPAARLLAVAAKRSPGIERRLGDLGPIAAPAAPTPAAGERAPARELPLVRPRSQAAPAPAPAAHPAPPPPRAQPPTAAPSRPAPPPAPAPPVGPAPGAPVFIDDHGGAMPASPAPPRPAIPPRPSIPAEREIGLVLEDDTSAALAAPQIAPAPAPPASPPPVAPAPVEFDLELEEVFVFDLDDDATPASQVAPPPDMLEKPPRPPAEVPPFEPAGAGRAAERAAAEAPAPWEEQPDFAFADEQAFFSPGAKDELDIDADLLERTAAELQPRRTEHEEDLLTEAEVLAKYGLKDKALERLEEVFQLNPNHLRAYALQIGLYLELGRLERVVMLANEMGAIAGELGEAEPWGETRERLLAAGFLLEGERRVLAAPGAAPAAAAAVEPEVALAPTPEPAAPEPIAFEPGAPPLELEEIALEPGPALEPAPVREPEPTVEPEPALEAEPAELDLSLEALDVPPLGGDLWPALEAPARALEVGALEVGEPEVGEQLTPLPAFEEAPPAAPPPAEAAPPAPQPAIEAPAPRKKKAALGDLDATLAAIAGTVKRKPAAKRPAAAPPPPAPPPPVEDGAGLFDLKSIGADVEAAARDAVPEPPAPPAPERAADFAATADDLDGIEIFAAEPSAPALDEADLSWLDEASARAATGPAADQKIFEAEEGFFNLAAELEEELKKEEAIHGESLFAQPHEQSLEEIVEGFKRGVAEHLSPEDYETHFNLGIAYREMGLLDEAIGEFQLAAKHPERLVDCCSMLGMCFIDKGLPELAVKWYKRGLDNPALTENESLGLLYELGSAYLLTGERDSAYKTFVDIYGVNTNYRDVVALLKELGH